MIRDLRADARSTQLGATILELPRPYHGKVRDNEKRPPPIITPTTKAFDGGHDEPLTEAEIVERGLLTLERFTGARFVPPVGDEPPVRRTRRSLARFF